LRILASILYRIYLESPTFFTRLVARRSTVSQSSPAGVSILSESFIYPRNPRNNRWQLSRRAAKRGERSKSSLNGASKQMVESMSGKQFEDFAHTNRKRLLTKKRKKKR
jgi:hypothetical protein